MHNKNVMKGLLAALVILVTLCPPSEAGVLRRIARKTLAVGTTIITLPITFAAGIGGATAIAIYGLAWKLDEIDRTE